MLNPDYRAEIEEEIDVPVAIRINDDIGLPGASAYELSGFEGTVDEWLESLQGLTAYEVAVVTGFVGSEEEWLQSLKATVDELMSVQTLVLDAIIGRLRV